MNRQYRRQLEAAVICLGLSTLMLLWIVLAIGFWNCAQSQCYTQRVIIEPVRDWRPDIAHCLADDVNTWDCIRNDPKPRQTRRT